MDENQEIIRRYSISQFVQSKHMDQTDKAGFDYYKYHLLGVGDLVRGENKHLYPVAIGHDLLEDTNATYDEMMDAGYTPREFMLIEVLTKPKEWTYAQYLRRIMWYRDAKIVKIADITSNLQRLYLLDDPITRNRLLRKYNGALQILAGVDK